MIVPPLFTCPISLHLFEDPVTLSTGQTYERSCIQKWLSQGNLTCPVTMQKLQDPSMVPNHTLRHLITNWLNSKPQMVSDNDDDDDDDSIAEIKQIIQSDHESTLENKMQVLEKVLVLTQELPLKNSCLIELNFFGILLELILKGTYNIIFIEKALLCAIKLMSFSDLRGFALLKQESKCEAFVLLFEKGSFSIKKNLCLIIETISSSRDSQEVSKKLGKSDKLMKEVIQLKSEAGIKALSALSLVEENRENLVKAGAVEGLIEYLYKTLAPMAVSTIEKLLPVGSVKEAIVNHAYGVKSIVKMVFRVSHHEGSDSALNVLLLICSDSKIGREKAIVDGVLTQLLLLLQSQCNGRIKTKARMLLKLLRIMWDDHPSNN